MGRWRRLAVVVVGAAGLLAGSLSQDLQAAGPAVAEVDGELISAEEVDQTIRTQISKLEEQIYTLRRQRLDAIIRDRLFAQEARRRGIPVQALLDAEVTAKVPLVTEQEIEPVFQANRGRLPADETEARERVRAALQNQKLAVRRDEFARSLRDGATVVVHLEAPPITRVEVPIDGAPVRGPASASVTIVEFSDFHCPFCKRVLPTLEQIMSRYGDRVKLVFRDYPLDQLHPGARAAHEAARCAHDQGKFWAYHDVLFDQAPRASAADLSRYARQVGLDIDVFEHCVASKKHAAAVQRDLEDGSRFGVSGTPAFFVNGRLISGAQPLDAFIRVIEDELQRLAKK